MEKIITVAVVMATYNGQKYLKDQLNSIVCQTRKPDKLVIVDDKSQDRTLEVCKDLLDKHEIEYTILVNSRNLGVAKSFFRGIKETEEDIIFLSDQDDVWMKDKIEKMLEKFENDKKCMEVLCNAYIWDDKSSLCYSLKETLNIQDYLFDKENKSFLWKENIIRNIATGMCMAFRKEVFYNIEKYLINNKNLMLHDSLIHLFCSAYGNISYISEPLVYYRQHGNNVVGINKKIGLKELRDLKKKTITNLQKSIERIELIKSLDENKKFLEERDNNFIKEYEIFLNDRREYITRHKIFKLIKLIINSKEKYPSRLIALRDIYVGMTFNHSRGNLI